jgi:hypothetical protein
MLVGTGHTGAGFRVNNLRRIAMRIFGSLAHRAVFAASLTASLLAIGCAAGPNAAQSADATAKAWAMDKYVPATDPRGSTMNAARVLADKEKATRVTMQVGAATAIIHERPSPTSPAIGMVGAGDAVKVLEEADFVRVPGTADMDEYVGDGAKSDKTPSWVKVEVGRGKSGWIPARALAKPLELATASDALASGRKGEVSKGFSEKVKIKATAMKGAAGTPKLKGANYEAADAIIERASKPLNFASKKGPWEVSPRLSGVAPIGATLATVDPQLAAAAAAATEKANGPSDVAQATDGLLSAAGQFGFSQADDPNVRLAAEVVKLVGVLTAPHTITPVEERLMGRECLAKVVGNSKVLPESHPVACYVRWVGTKVAANSTALYPSLGLDFIVIDDNAEINAVAVPGGPIVITTGMLKFLDSEDELAAILGHELCHVEERHGLSLAARKGMDKWPSLIAFAQGQANGQAEKYIGRLLADAKLSPELTKAATAQIVAEVKKMLDEGIETVVMEVVAESTKGADQGVETGADLRGMSLACAAGYDPLALDAALERLKAMTGQYGGSNYDAKRAELARSVVGLLPFPQGGASASGSAADAPPQRATTSKEAADRWSQLDAKLGKS